MAVNKVVYGGATLIDLTGDTVESQSLKAGMTAHDRSGALITGTFEGEELGFTVVGGTEAPSSPGENTLWVNTSAPVTACLFSAAQPSTAAEGMVRFSLGTQASYAFNALDRDGIVLCVEYAEQYVSGAWVRKSAKIYHGGAWTLFGSIFDNGSVSELVTGINGPVTSTDISFDSVSVSKSNNRSYTANSKIDLTNYQKLYLEFTSPNTFEGAYFRVYVDDAAANGTNLTTSSLLAYANSTSPFNGATRIIEVNISGLTGEYYVGYAIGVPSDAPGSNTKSITGTIYRWWLT